MNKIVVEIESEEALPVSVIKYCINHPALNIARDAKVTELPQGKPLAYEEFKEKYSLNNEYGESAYDYYLQGFNSAHPQGDMLKFLEWVGSHECYYYWIGGWWRDIDDTKEMTTAELFEYWLNNVKNKKL